MGINCIEHFYGVGDASLDGIQDFPPEHNASNEIIASAARASSTSRTTSTREAVEAARRHGRETRRVEPTMSTYEANRDLVKAQNLPWYKDYLHPSLEDYMAPSMTRHGAYWMGWTNTQEARWRKNYQVWMAAAARVRAEGRPYRHRRRRRLSVRVGLRLRDHSRARAARGGRLPSARGHPARDGRGREDPRPRRQARPHPRRLHRPTCSS